MKENAISKSMASEAKVTPIIDSLQAVQNKSTHPLIQKKTAKAISDLKRAKTLIEKAQATLIWAEHREASLTALNGGGRR